ncbi:MAG: 5-methyltetrahydrofolate--homocysteine methyltransferase [Thermotogaceae bacterium]|nr:5-methyltetrahydrofolate--homocysteine methyltransferase [Thermotogaceae bacterium]MDN5337427.1 5-methyltetrahydrofolate--homocysteine methyltransferase [Thermotogaceae bacterium]
MNRKNIESLLREKGKLLLDGAHGTYFMSKGYTEEIPDLLNLKAVDAVLNHHVEYLKAGADIHLTNTFNSSREKLKKYGIEDLFEKLNIEAVRIARKAVGEKALVFGDIGPTGSLLKPLGELSFDEAFENFREQTELLIENGVDGIMLETFSDILELKAAYLAVRDISKDIFLIAHLTFEENGKTLTGTGPEAFAALFNDLDVDAIGINCSVGPHEMLPVFQQLSKYSKKFLSVEPNAGIPVLENGVTRFPVGPEEFSKAMLNFVKSGARIIGGCCGTTPEHIKLLRKLLDETETASPEVDEVELITSRTNMVNPSEKFIVVGERLNYSGSKKTKKFMEEKNIEELVKIGLEQKNSGADLIDVNFGLQRDLLFSKEFIIQLENRCGIPISFDVQDIQLLEELLRVYPGRPLINSSRALESDLELFAELLKKYGGMLILLSAKDSFEEDFEYRFKSALNGVEMLEKLGVSRTRIFVDPLVFSMGAGHDPLITLRLIERFNKSGLKTIIGLSNLSYGMPLRKDINAVFLSLSLERGLSAAIMNPNDERVMNSLKVYNLIFGKDELIFSVENKESNLINSILSGETKQLKEILEKELTQKSFAESVEEIIRPVMREIGELYEANKIYLPQLLTAAKVVKEVMEFFEEKEKSKTNPEKSETAKVILATVKGDIHDIGKNLVAALMKSNGVDVIDLGRDVDSEKIVEVAKREKPVLIGLSAMMTTTVPRVKEVVEKLKGENLNIPVITGGASMTEKLAKEFGADYYAHTAIDGLRILRSLIHNESNLQRDSGRT